MDVSLNGTEQEKERRMSSRGKGYFKKPHMRLSVAERCDVWQ